MNDIKMKKILIMTLVFIMLSASWVLAVDVVKNGDHVRFFTNNSVPDNTTVVGSVVTLFGNAKIEGEVTGDVVTLFGNAKIAGKVHGDTVTIFGNANIAGQVNGDVVAVIGGIEVGGTGQINGSGVSVLGHGIDNQGIIRQETVSILGFLPKGLSGAGILLTIILILTMVKHIVALGFSVIAVILFNDRLDKMANRLDTDPGKKLLIGILVYVGTFVGMAILVMTVIGVPLAVLLLPALMLLEFLANTTAKIAIGRRIAQRQNKSWSIMMELITGSLIYTILDISIVGKVFTLVFKLIGMGEIIDSRFGESKNIGPKGV